MKISKKLVVALVIALLMMAKGGYMQAKAHFAQYLIEHAFDKTLLDQQPHKPWSWADTYPVAKMTFLRHIDNGKPKSMYVLAGSSGRTLAFGPGMMMLGADVTEHGNTIIAGHRDTHFSLLEFVSVGDIIELINYEGYQIQYEVEKVEIVHESDTQILQPTQENILTLVTCYPFQDLASQTEYRYVIQAKSIDISYRLQHSA
ncbi:class GN sortase [Shewanella maritima]|uniref:class GN sortase n=1 Tax=Shewanella maritima TaxID=2520507 RepID=UPI0037369AD9